MTPQAPLPRHPRRALGAAGRQGGHGAHLRSGSELKQNQTRVPNSLCTQKEPFLLWGLWTESLGIIVICSEMSKNCCLHLPGTIFIFKDDFKRVKPWQWHFSSGGKMFSVQVGYQLLSVNVNTDSILSLVVVDKEPNLNSFWSYAHTSPLPWWPCLHERLIFPREEALWSAIFDL